MFGFGLFSKKELPTRVAVFEISSHAVSAHVVEYFEKASPRVLHTARYEFHMHAWKYDGQLLMELEKGIDHCNADITIHVHKPIDRVICVLTSPWCASQLRIVEHDRGTPFVFDMTLANKMVSEEMRDLVATLEKKAATIDEPLVLVDHKVQRVKLNGYTTDDPINKEATSVQVYVQVTYIEERILAVLKDAIARSFSATITFHASMFAASVVVGDVCGTHGAQLIVSVDGDMTDVGMVDDGILFRTVSYPAGFQRHIRSLGSVSTSNAHAVSLLSLYRSEHLHEDHYGDVAASLTESKRHWVANFEQALAALGIEDFSLTSLLLCVDSEHAAWLQGALVDMDILQGISIATNKDENFKGLLRGVSGLPVARDSIAILFAARLLELEM